ncbi:YggT family protein [Saccharopolyspora aridisoli]
MYALVPLVFGSGPPVTAFGPGALLARVARWYRYEASRAHTWEFVMSAIGTVLGYALTAYLLVLVARLVLDWARTAAEGPHWVRRARALTHTATEPVIAPVRRVLRPVRVGEISLDLAFTAVFVVVLVLRSAAFSL